MAEKDLKSFMDNVLSGSKATHKQAETDAKDQLSDIFERGAWKQAVQQRSTPDASSKDVKGDVASNVTKNQERGVRFPDTPQYEPSSIKANPASKLDSWLQQDSVDLGFEIKSMHRDMQKSSPEKTSSTHNLVTARTRQRGIVDLSFLGLAADDPDTKAAVSVRESKQPRKGGMESSDKAGTSTTAATARDMGPSTSFSGENRTRGLDWLGLGGETSPREGKQSSKDERHNSPHHGGGTWLPGKAQKVQVNERGDKVLDGEDNDTMLLHRGHSLDRDSARIEEMEDLVAGLRADVANLKCRLKLAEQEKDFYARQIDSMKEMHETELTTCKEMYKRLQTMVESGLTEQHQKTVVQYESEIQRMAQKVATLELDQARLEEESAQKVKKAQQRCREEVNALQEIHNILLGKLKAEQQEEMQRAKRVENQEAEVVCSTLHQTRDTSSEMSDKQRREIQSFPSKLEETLLDDKVRQLQALETALRDRQDEMKEQLQEANNLVAYLRQLNSRQSQQVQEERWRLREEIVQFQSYRKAQEEKANFVEDELQRQRASLELIKSTLLREQQNLLRQIASLIKESREAEDGKTTLVVGRVSDQARAARLENREREVDAALLGLGVGQRDLENKSLAANQLWEKCKKRERFLATWEAQLYARESVLLKEKLSLLQRKRKQEESDVGSKLKADAANLWQWKTDEDKAYLQEQTSFVQNLRSVSSASKSPES